MFSGIGFVPEAGVFSAMILAGNVLFGKLKKFLAWTGFEEISLDYWEAMAYVQNAL